MSVETNFRDAFRLITWRRPLSPFATLTPVAILGVATVIALLSVGVQWLAAGETRYFQIYGLNALAAWIAASFVVIILFARKDATGATTRNLVLVWAATCAGAFMLPGFAKFTVVKKPATKERTGINPFTKEPTVFKAKPARKTLKARPVKAAKDAV